MITYMALLRGVNVGGKKRVVMSTLKEYFEQHGFIKVVTYLNSGNVIFDSEETDILQLKKDCEALIELKFGFEIAVTIISGTDLLDVLEQTPKWWNTDKE